MKLKSLFVLLGVILCASTFFVACSDDDDDLPNYRAGNYHYDVTLVNDNYSMEMDIDSVGSEIIEIENLPEWISMKQLKFDKEGHPIMKIDVQADPRGKSREADVVLKTKGGDNINLSFFQSMVYSTLGFQSNDQSGFDYSNWFAVEEIQIYDKNLNALRTVNLPWASISQTAMPEEYCSVNKQPDKWKLCFNTCSNPNLPDSQMFGLFNIQTHLMRVYVYFDEAPTDATSCFFVVNTNNKSSAILTSESMPWAVSMEKAKENESLWHFPSELIDKSPVSGSSTVIPPVCGNLQGSINRGWVAFDIKMFSNYNNIKDIAKFSNSKICLSMLACQITNTTGTQDFSKLSMKSDSINVVSPGSSTKCASLTCKALGNLFSGVASTIANSITTFSINKDAGIATAAIGGAGVACNFVSDCIDAGDAAHDNVAYSMIMDFHFSGETKINTKSITYKSNNFAPITMTIGEMFKYLIAYKAPQRHVVQKENNESETINLGIWNLVKDPIIYVSKDVLLYNESTYGTEYYSDGTTISSIGSDENLRYASFLDPSSIQVFINDDLSMFPHDKVKNIEIVGYDFVFCNTSFWKPDIFYDYYSIQNEKMCLTTENNSWNNIFIGDSKSMRLVECNDKNLLLDPEKGKLTYKTMAYLADGLKDNGYTFKYGGVYSDFIEELASYNVIYSPIVYVPRNENGLYPVKSYFSNIGVAVYVKFDIDDIHYQYARRFLPKIKTFGKSDIAGIRNNINNFNKTTADGLSADYKLFDQEKAKALKILKMAE